MGYKDQNLVGEIDIGGSALKAPRIPHQKL